MKLVPHRILLLESGKIAILAEDSNAWAILDSQSDYLRIVESLSEKNSLPDKIDRQLFDAGLLIRKGNVIHPQAIKKKLASPRSLLLKLTGACNICCDYCYDYEKSRWQANLNLDRIKETADKLLEKQESISVVFHGGEPLLRFNLIEETVNYLNEQKKPVRFSIQTNAALLNDHIVSFLEKNNFSVGLSIDGHTETANKLRKTKGEKTALQYFTDALNSYPEFIRKRCGVLSVVSKANIHELPDFALWLQEKEINNLGLSFMDNAGKGIYIPKEKVTDMEAVELFKKICNLIEQGVIKDIQLTALTSRISNLYQFHSKDFCHKGPCAAADEFLVLDAEGNYRTCDSIYHDFFEIGDKLFNEKEMNARQRVIARHGWLKNESLSCIQCPLIALCGGTCPAKAIAANNNPYSIDAVDCAISKFLFPHLLNEFSTDRDKPLFQYYESFK